MSRLNRFHTLILATALAGCAGSQPADQASVEIKGSDPNVAAAPAPVQPRTGANGIVSYDSYQAAAARQGDTVATVAARIGLSASELGAYNGLAPNHPLMPGDELVLPPRPGGYGGAPAAQQQVAQAPGAPLPGAPLPGAQPPAAQPYAQTPGSSWNSAGSNTAIVAAPLDGTPPGTPPGAAPTDGWSPDVAAAAIDRSETFNSQGHLTAPPSAAEPLPPSPQAPGTLQSPRLGQYQTPVAAPPAQPQARPVETITTSEAQVAEPAVTPTPPSTTELAAAPPRATGSGLSLLRPVRGPVVIGFQQGAGRARNDGIDFAAPAGSAVIAASDGEVALVSQSIGGLGNIVLLRHQGEYLTVYGRIDRVTVHKGDLVRRGQKIGVVATSPEPRMHFEVRKGAESLDPEKFF